MNSPTNERHFQAWSILINGALYLTMVAVTGLWTAHLAATYLAIICFGAVYFLATARLAQMNGADITFSWAKAWILIALMAFVAGALLFMPYGKSAPGACLTIAPTLSEWLAPQSLTQVR